MTTIPPCGTAADRPLTYAGTLIQWRGEFVNLTTMWCAMERPRNRHPNDWLRLPDTQRFLLHLANQMAEAPTAARIDDAGPSRVRGLGTDDLILTTRGRKRRTWAHWQLAMAYAHYLSPAFHAWCNQVLPDGMERDCEPSSASAEPMIGYLQQQFGTLHRRLDTLDRHGGDIMFLVISSQELMMGRRRSFSQLSRATIRRVVALSPFKGRCPCCRAANVLLPGGVTVSGAEFDHFFHCGINRPEHGWLICKQCHEDFARGGYLVRFSKMPAFREFQAAVLAFTQAQFRSTENNFR
jgi:hypothetical protein